MESRIDEEEGEVLAATSNSSSAAYPNLKTYTYADKFPVSDDDDDDDDDDEREAHDTTTSTRRFSLNDRTPPKVFDRFYDSSSDDDDFFWASSGGSGTSASALAGKRLDYMIQFLDRKLSSSGNSVASTAALPEFVASGGGTGIFKVPVRAAVCPGRPPCLELRPHPLRETQIGCFLRNMACIGDSQLWAGSECSVRFWNLSDVYSSPGMMPMMSPPPSGDEDTAPFRESVHTSPTLCLTVDAGNRVVWSGHKDGKIRCWKMDDYFNAMPFNENLSWQAHRGPVLSIVFTSYGLGTMAWY